MALIVTLVYGPRRSGKSTIIREMISQIYDRAPHYLRLTAVGGDKQRPVCLCAPADKCGVASARWLHYAPERVYEELPEVLSRIHRDDRYGHVIIEADGDPGLLHAYPYTTRLFVMPAPRSLGEVFRSTTQTAETLQRMLDDTVTFASEVFGLCPGEDCLDDDTREERPALTASQVSNFLHTPLGDELVTRTSLQPDYHGLVESDMVLINSAVGGATSVVDITRHSIERMLGRLCEPAHRDHRVYCCDPLNARDPLRQPFYDAMVAMCAGSA
jgi:hypothetical protein